MSVCPVCVSVCTRACMHAHTCAHTHARARAHTGVRTVHTCVHVLVPDTCVHTRVHVHAHQCCVTGPVVSAIQRANRGQRGPGFRRISPGAPGEEKQRWIRPAFPESGSKSLPRRGWAHQGAGLCRLPDVQPWAPLGSRSLSFSVCRVGSSWLLARRKDPCGRGGTVAAGRASGSPPPPLLLVEELPWGGTALAWRSSPRFLPAGRTQEGEGSPGAAVRHLQRRGRGMAGAARGCPPSTPTVCGGAPAFRAPEGRLCGAGAWPASGATCSVWGPPRVPGREGG